MSGAIILGTGIGMLLLSVGLLIASVVYRSTVGKKIQEELKSDY